MTNCPCDPMLGSGKAVVRYSEGLRRRGHEVEVLEPKNFEIFPGLSRGMQYRQAIGAWRVAAARLATAKYDLIEFYGAEFGFAARRLSGTAPRPVMVAHTNGLEPLAAQRARQHEETPGFRGRASRHAMDFIGGLHFRHTDKLVCMASPDLRYAIENGFYAEDDTILVPHGVDEVFRARPFVEDKSHRVAFSGSWIARKGVEILARVMTRVLKDDPALSLDLVGCGESAQHVLRSFPEEVHRQVVVHPSRLQVSELADILSHAKVFFFPSRYEGFGLAVTEAMCCSCAVVGTPAGVIADLAADRQAAVFDDADETGMEEAIVRLLRDDEARRSLALRGWQRATTMTWDAAIDLLDATYRRWVADGPRAASPLAT